MTETQERKRGGGVTFTDVFGAFPRVFVVMPSKVFNVGFEGLLRVSPFVCA